MGRLRVALRGDGGPVLAWDMPEDSTIAEELERQLGWKIGPYHLGLDEAARTTATNTHDPPDQPPKRRNGIERCSNGRRWRYLGHEYDFTRMQAAAVDEIAEPWTRGKSVSGAFVLKAIGSKELDLRNVFRRDGHWHSALDEMLERYEDGGEDVWTIQATYREVAELIVEPLGILKP